MDAALTPVVDDREAVDELEMIRTHAASANRLQRAHIHRHGEADVNEPLEHEPIDRRRGAAYAAALVARAIRRAPDSAERCLPR